MVLYQLAKLYLYFSVIGPSAVNSRVITGTADILPNPTPLVIDAEFGNFCRLSCCFNDCILQSCLTCNNGSINMENNFVLFYLHTK